MTRLVLALVYGAVSGFSVLAGGLIFLAVKLGQRVIALIMAFGAGVLIASLAYGLIEEAFGHGGLDATAVGLIAGAVLYYAVHLILFKRHSQGGSHLRLQAERSNPGLALLAGVVLDGLPEQFVIGVGLRIGSNLGLLVMVAVVLSNVAESIVATPDLAKTRPLWQVLTLWGIVGLLSTAATLVGYLSARAIPGDLLAILLAFSAGAVLAMIADTMLPEAYRRGGSQISLATVGGFLVAFLLARMS